MVDLPSGQIDLLKRKKRYKRKPFKPIDREHFKDLRLANHLTINDVAVLLHVTNRTVSSWESGHARIPYSAFKLLRSLANGELISKDWKGWRVFGDTLYAPTGRAFKQHELYYLTNYITMARYWLQARETKQIRAQVISIKPKLTVFSEIGDFNAIK